MQDVLQALGILLGSAMLVLVHEGRRVLLVNGWRDSGWKAPLAGPRGWCCRTALFR